VRRGALAAATLATLLGLAVPAGAAAAEPCGTGSWTAGTVDLCAGELVYRDYVYDDYGADTRSFSAPRPGTLSTPAGDQRSPKNARASADLVSLRLRVDGDRLAVTAELNALYAADQTVLALAFDTDDDQSTGGGPWSDLGVSSKGWEKLHTLDRGDPARNTITGSIPLPPGDRWRVQALTAAKDGPVMNVAFRGPDEQAAGTFTINAYVPSDVGTWFEDKQARALRDGDISEFGHQVAVADLRGGVTRRAVVGPGLHERVYVSKHTVPPGEGITFSSEPERTRGRGTGGSVSAFSQYFDLRGKYQPYGVYVPRRPGPHGVQFVYHGSNASLSSLINQPGMQQSFGEDLNRILVVPEARGPDGYGSDISERDLLDVYDDVLATYDVDRDRIFVGGYSQGGYIAFRMAALYPDRFAGLVSWVGFTGDDTNGTPARGTVGVTAGAVGNMIDFVGNHRQIPAALVYAGADELVPLPSANAMADEYRRREYAYEFFLHPAAEHLTFGPADDWRKEAAFTKELRRVRDPARVTFRTDPTLGNRDLGIVHDRAYWVSAIRGRAAGYEDVDLTSHGCGGPLPVSETGRNAGPQPVPWVSDFRRITGSRRIPVANRIEGTLTNVASLEIDTARACLGEGRVDYALETDGPVVVTLSDGRTIRLASAGRHAGSLAARPRETPAPTARGCTAITGFRSVAARAAGRGLRVDFAREVPGPVDVDVFQQSRGRRVIGERLVARFTGQTAAFSWDGKANRPGRRVTDGYHFVRYRIALPGRGRADVRRVTLRRARGRFTMRRSFYRRASCGILSAYKLTRPVFGGRDNRAIGISYRLSRSARVRVDVLRGRRVVRSFGERDVPAGRTVRLRLEARRLARGDYTFRLVARRGDGTVTSTLGARRL
jgi:pimeloyl-ACP methyl ester carboxylesterase